MDHLCGPKRVERTALGRTLEIAYQMPMRPYNASNLGRILPIIFQDINDVLLDWNFHSNSSDLIYNGFGTVLEVFPYSQIEYQGVVFRLRIRVLMFDEKAVAAGLQEFRTFDRRFHEHCRRDSDCGSCVDD
jgi:hypothetical protein